MVAIFASQCTNIFMRISSQEVEYMIDPLARYIACALEKFASVSDYKDKSALMALKDNKTSGFSTDFPLPCRLVYSRRRFLHWTCVKASPKKYIQYSYINHARISRKVFPFLSKKSWTNQWQKFTNVFSHPLASVMLRRHLCTIFQIFFPLFNHIADVPRTFKLKI